MTVAELKHEIDDLKRKVRDMEQEKALIPNPVVPDAPPRWVLLAARAALDKTGYWSGYYDVLTSYYGLHTVHATVNPNLSGAVAQYDSNYLINPKIESKGKTMTDRTALHEFFHHLFYSTRHRHEGEGEQRLADAFADECLRKESAP